MNATEPAGRFGPRRAAPASGSDDWHEAPVREEVEHAPLVDVRRMWSAIRRSRYVIAAILGIAFVAGIASILLIPPTYRARASVQIDQQTTRVLGTEERDPIDGAASDAERFLQTQVDILRSRALAIRVADDGQSRRIGRVVRTSAVEPRPCAATLGAGPGDTAVQPARSTIQFRDPAADAAARRGAGAT
jgi:hypothetical protein